MSDYLEVSTQAFFRLKAGNGEIVLASGNGIASVKENALVRFQIRKRTAINGKYYFVSKSSNSQIIRTSQMHENISGRDHGIKVVKKTLKLR